MVLSPYCRWGRGEVERESGLPNGFVAEAKFKLAESQINMLDQCLIKNFNITTSSACGMNNHLTQFLPIGINSVDCGCQVDLQSEKNAR